MFKLHPSSHSQLSKPTSRGKIYIPWERRKLQIVQSGLNKNTEMSSRMYFHRKLELLTVKVSR